MEIVIRRIMFCIQYSYSSYTFIFIVSPQIFCFILKLSQLNRIKHTYILDDPFDDPPQLAELIPDASPEGKPKDEVDIICYNLYLSFPLITLVMF